MRGTDTGKHALADVNVLSTRGRGHGEHRGGAHRESADGLGVGAVDFGDLRRLDPIDRRFGFDRGLCIDRYYIEAFLGRHADDIRGRVLEVADDAYTRRFGGARVTRSDVLHLEPGGARTTIVADLTRGDPIPSAAFDCVILTQTLMMIFDLRAAVRTLHRILKPGGVLLATNPGISQISRYDMDRWGDCWRLTTKSARRLLEEAFPAQHVEVTSAGNVLAAVAFLHGLCAGDLAAEELEHHDPDYQLLITMRAVKPQETP
ncbi:MAG: methyltransferase domain-containing protein [Phycisphaerales bacterium]|nr:MAG: methyltransferase domain-containing protein [Phycisphaerales bacterium]